MTRTVFIYFLVLVIAGTLGAAGFLFYQRNINAKCWDSMHLAESMLESKDYKAAANTLLPIVAKGKRFEGADKAMYNLALAYEGAGKNEAKELWDRIARDFPKSSYFPEAQLRRANNLVESKPADAKRIFDEVIKSASDEVKAKAQIGIASLLEKDNKRDEAKKLYYSIIEESSPTWEVESRVKDRLTEINKQALWSPSIDEFSQAHVVQKGESPDVISNKYKTTSQYIIGANGGRNTLHPGQNLKVPKEPFALRVNKKRCRIELILLNSAKFIRWYPCGVGKENGWTPAGDYKILNKEINPTWFKPGGGVVKPLDPENALGTRWMGIGNNLGVHGTNAPDSIGKPESAGCIRMQNQDVEELYKIVTYGSRVTIIEGS